MAIGAADNAGCFNATAAFPFLEHFLPNAERHWESGASGELRSGIWTESGSDGTELHLDATACRVGGERLLLIRRVETEFDQLQRALQRGRELMLTHERLVAETSKKEILLHCVIHDLSGPLSGITGALDILRQEDLSKEGRRFLELGRVGARQQANLIGDLLDSFRAEIGALDHLELDPAQAPDIIECTREVIDALKPAFAVRGVTARLVFGPAVADRARVVAEHNRLQRVLHNLLQNALRYSAARGLIVVTLALEGGFTRVCVDDEGDGIAPEVASQLFQKFVRGRGATGKAGLGLFFCRITVEQWGGAIGCEPLPGRGTRFWFRLKTI
jgi:hypothetical protein